jgi:hypothetical protein
MVVWYTYRNKNMLKVSALVRTIAAEATIYFTVIVAVQIYTQLSFSFVDVCSLGRFLRCVMMS